MVSDAEPPSKDQNGKKEPSRDNLSKFDFNQQLLLIFATSILLVNFMLGFQYINNKYALDKQRLNLETQRLELERQRLDFELQHEKAIGVDSQPQAGLASVRDVLMEAKSDPSKLQAVIQGASALIDTLVGGAKITAAEGSDIKKVLIEKGVGGGIDAALKIVDRLIDKYLGLSDGDDKSKLSSNGVTVNVYCSGTQKPKTAISDPPHPPKKNTCGGTVNKVE